MQQAKNIIEDHRNKHDIPTKLEICMFTYLTRSQVARQPPFEMKKQQPKTVLENFPRNKILEIVNLAANAGRFPDRA